MKLTILSPERRLLEGQAVDEVTLVGSEGQFQILDGHAPMVGTLETGEFGYRGTDGKNTVGFIASGFFEVKNDEVVVTAEALELKSEIDVERARKAQLEAERVLKEADLDPNSFNQYQLKLQRALIRQQVASKDHA
jgi:F-type H+-transporting ATPase subunit epsilon